MTTDDKKSALRLLDPINDFLDRHVLPWPVRFLTFRFVIILTMLLLIPLILFGNNTVLVLGLNSYLNTMSVAVSSIVLLYATLNEARQKQIAEMQEQRAQADHEHVTDMHRLIMEMLSNQQRELQALNQALADMQGKEYTPSAVPDVQDLRAMHPLGDERYEAENIEQRWDENVHHSVLASTLRKRYESRRNRNSKKNK